MQRILDTESRHRATSENFPETIEESLMRQQLDGILTDHDLTELGYITDLWTNLLNATSCFAVGCVFCQTRYNNIFTRIVFVEADYE